MSEIVVNHPPSQVPQLVVIVSNLLGASLKLNAVGSTSHPVLISAPTHIQGEIPISAFIAGVVDSPQAQALLGQSPLDKAVILQWLFFLSGASLGDLDVLEQNFLDRTFLATEEVSLADLFAWNWLNAAPITVSSHPHTFRWLSTLRNTFDFDALNRVPEKKSNRPEKKGKPAKSEEAAAKGTDRPADQDNDEVVLSADGSLQNNTPPLENAVHGQVVTRFPPEVSHK